MEGQHEVRSSVDRCIRLTKQLNDIPINLQDTRFTTEKTAGLFRKCPLSTHIPRIAIHLLITLVLMPGYNNIPFDDRFLCQET